MGRRSSFGSRLGAYRNRQIRLEIGRSNRSSRKQVATEPPDELSTGCAIFIGIVFILFFIWFCSCVSYGYCWF
jgi:hypothetical protein